MSAYIEEEDRSGRAVRRDMRRSRVEDHRGPLVRRMDDVDLWRILELREAVRWSGDPRAFDLLRGMGEAHWAVAEDGSRPGGRVVGMVGAVPLGEVGILCHLAVHGGHRGRGLGARLTSWAVSYLLSRGVKTVRLDSTRAAEGLYRSMGFEPVFARTEYRLEGGALAARLRGERLRGVRNAGGVRVAPLSFGDLPELYGVDLWSYGADRSALILATLRRYPGWGLVARDSAGSIKGYLVRSASGATVRVGPFMASSPEVADALLSRALETDGGRSVEVSLPAPKGSPAHELLREFGFVGRRDRLRMELGEEPRTEGLRAYGTTPYLAT